MRQYDIRYKVFLKKIFNFVYFFFNWGNPGNTWQYSAISGNTWQYSVILLQYLPIPNHTCQFQTIPNKPGIAWYGLVSTIHGVLPLIRLQYCHGIVTLWFWCFSVCLALSLYQNLWCLVFLALDFIKIYCLFFMIDWCIQWI